jgi:hypothetical protein
MLKIKIYNDRILSIPFTKLILKSLKSKLKIKWKYSTFLNLKKLQELNKPLHLYKAPYQIIIEAILIFISLLRSPQSVNQSNNHIILADGVKILMVNLI